LPYLAAGGRRLEYVWHGPGPASAPTLVFLHEGLGCVTRWRDFPEQVAAAAGCGALVYSRAGYGGSDRNPPPWGPRFLHREALVLPEVLDAAGVREAVLVGHSDGGSIALIHAGATEPAGKTPPPPCLHSLVLLAPHVFCEDVTLASIRAAVEAYRHDDLRERLERHHGANVDDAFLGWSGAWLDPAFREWTIEDSLPGVRVPALVVQGADDPFGTLRQLDAIEAGCRGGVRRLVLAECGHAPHRDQPEATLHAVADFVAGVRAAHRARI
jgi:pimeloyl-ACP methyl ester carboxylesterase